MQGEGIGQNSKSEQIDESGILNYWTISLFFIKYIEKPLMDLMRFLKSSWIDFGFSGFFFPFL